MSLSANGQKDFGDSFGADILTRMCSNKEKLAASNGIKYDAFNCDMLLETLKFGLSWHFLFARNICTSSKLECKLGVCK